MTHKNGKVLPCVYVFLNNSLFIDCNRGHKRFEIPTLFYQILNIESSNNGK